MLPAIRESWHSRLYLAEAGTRLSDPGGMQGWVDLVGWLHTEMVYPPKGGHPSKYKPGPMWVNFVHATNATTPCHQQTGRWGLSLTKPKQTTSTFKICSHYNVQQLATDASCWSANPGCYWPSCITIIQIRQYRQAETGQKKPITTGVWLGTDTYYSVG